MAKEDRDEDKNGGAVAAAPKKKAPRKPAPKRNPPKQLPPWKVLLHNDDINDVGYVVETIVILTPLNPERAITCTKEAHKSGLSLLLTTHKERAELYQEQFQSKGLTVTIELAE